ncbi:MAG TPA: hypothetical protein VFR05_08185 [Terriglobia bacterium]|nr:hypothetical protein [Terriglobia bacterium]
MRLRSCILAISATLALPAGLFAKCPIAPDGRLVLRAPVGNLFLETNGTDSVEVEVSNRQVVVQEICRREAVEISATAPANVGVPDWKIRVPKGVTLDLSTQGGSIQIEDTDGEALLRTSGGKITAGHIKGNALIYGTEVRTGNIGGNAEIIGRGGRMILGDIGGNMDLKTPGGDVSAGYVRGHVKAEMGSGAINIRESAGDVVITTKAGDIKSEYIKGSFDGRTESGNIRVGGVGSWVRAITGVGDIFIRMVPTNIAGDLHVTAQAAFGDITLYVPKAMKATIDAVIEKPPLNSKGRIFSDFALKAPVSAIMGLQGLLPGGPERQGATVNGGGNNIKVRTSVGTINIRAD